MNHQHRKHPFRNVAPVNRHTGQIEWEELPSLADSLKRRPADLTLIARNNGGTFDKALVQRIIDGRNPVKGHGGGDMPVWGDAFERSADAGPQMVSARIDALAEYIGTLQVK